MSDVFVVTPRPNTGGRRLHIYAPEYRTQKPRSEHSPSALCGQSANTKSGSERTGWRTVGRRHVPIREAIEWLNKVEPSPNPLSPPWPVFSWCPHCLGRLAAHLGGGDLTWLVAAILDRAEATT